VFLERFEGPKVCPPASGPVPGPEIRLKWRDGMSKIVQFIKESYAELRKVIWPSRDDVISSVKVVIVSTILIAAVLGLVDVLLLLGVQAIF
jgi:preprotein translocase subunit SecE